MKAAACPGRNSMHLSGVGHEWGPSSSVDPNSSDRQLPLTLIHIATQQVGHSHSMVTNMLHEFSVTKTFIVKKLSIKRHYLITKECIKLYEIAIYYIMYSILFCFFIESAWQIHCRLHIVYNLCDIYSYNNLFVYPLLFSHIKYLKV